MTLCTCSQAGATRASDEPLCTQPKITNLVPIEMEPLIGETPQATLQSWLTPNPLFYVRNHFKIPAIEANSWNLSIDGHVSSPLTLTLEDFRQFPKQTLPVTLECAGNNRSDLHPQVPGNPFQNGAVSTAIWGGLPLRHLLAQVDMKPGSIEVLFEGLDSGQTEPGKQAAPYLRSLPLDIATHPHTLLAHEMNGEPLTREHGYPLRLIVPGWYGMASVKWLRRISILNEKFSGFFQTDRYVIEEDDGKVKPLANMNVKSLISWPQKGASLSMKTHNISGLAWSGFAEIRHVEFSDDGGETWRDAEMVGPRYRYAWQQWNYLWHPPAPGHYTLMARAEDEAGNLQPMKTKWNRLGYIVNGVKPVCVSIQ